MKILNLFRRSGPLKHLQTHIISFKAPDFSFEKLKVLLIEWHGMLAEHFRHLLKS